MNADERKRMEATNAKLDRLISQNNYIIELLEQMHDDAHGLEELHRRYVKNQQELRQLEYEQHFLAKGEKQ